MGKKGKARKITLNFQTIEQDIATGKYQAAALAMRKAKVPPKDQRQLETLQIKAHYLWALSHFKEGQYTQAIAMLRMFIERYKKKMTLPLEKANVLIGISYLYNNKWEKAIFYLKDTVNDPLTSSFSFYYLLAVIYQQTYSQFSDFLTQHEQAINHLTGEQKKYLEIAFALVQGNFTNAQVALSSNPSTANQNSQNLLALKTLLEGENKSIADDASIKGLYKYLLKQPLKTWEEVYLNTIPQLKDYSIERKHSKIKTQLAGSVKQLCEEGIPLSRSGFEDCMSLPEEYLPYLVYNQVAALFNEDIEGNESRVVFLLKKYEWHFFQVPESPFLFAQIAYWDDSLFTPNYFWRILETSLNRFGKSYTKLQLNRLSWSIFSCLKQSDYGKGNSRKKGSRDLLKLAKSYPSMLGLKLWHLMDYMMIPDSHGDEFAFDLFTFGEFQYGSEFAVEYLGGSLKDSASLRDLAMLEFGGGHFLPDEALIQTIHIMEQAIVDRLFSFIKKTTIDREVHLKNKAVLDIYIIAYKQFLLYQKRGVVLSEEQIQTFATGYKKQLDLFEESPNSDSYLNYQALLEGPLLKR